MTGNKKKTITSTDREKYIEQIRMKAGMVTRRVVHAKFTANDILGADVISYTPMEIVMDQTTDVHHIPDRKHTIEAILGHPPTSHAISVYVHGIEGQPSGRDVFITRHVAERWMPDGTWERMEMPVPTTALKL